MLDFKGSILAKYSGLFFSYFFFYCCCSVLTLSALSLERGNMEQTSGPKKNFQLNTKASEAKDFTKNILQKIKISVRVMLF